MSVPSVDKSSDTVKSTGVVFSWVWKIDSITDHYLFWGAGPEAELPVSSQWEFIASLAAWMSTVNSCQASAFRSKLPIIAALTPFPRLEKKTGDVYLDSDSSLIVATQLGIFIVSSVFAPITMALLRRLGWIIRQPALLFWANDQVRIQPRSNCICVFLLLPDS